MKRNKVSRIFTAICLSLCACLLIACGNKDENKSSAEVNNEIEIFKPSDTAPEGVVSRVVKTDDGKGYLEVDGEPYFYVGMQNMGAYQLTHHGHNAMETSLDIEWLENLFEKTKNAGYDTIQIILKWREIEPEQQGVYDFTYIEKYLEYAKKYDLRIDWVWFGCMGVVRLDGYVAGDSTPIPKYLQDHDKYFGLEGKTNLTEYHYMWLPEGEHKSDIEYLMQCERDAVAALFAYFAEHDDTHRTILFQLDNEPNGHAEWLIGKEYFYEQLNNLGKVIKESDYVVATRVNLLNSGGEYLLNMVDINELEYVDFVGYDPYTTSVDAIKSLITSKVTSDLLYIGENSPDYENASSLMATAIVNGGFYNSWMLNDCWGSHRVYDPTQTLYTDWEVGKEETLIHSANDVKNLLNGLSKISQLVAVTPAENMVGFNIAQDMPNTTYTNYYTLGEYEVGFNTNGGSIGVALVGGEKKNQIFCVSDNSYTSPENLAANAKSVTQGLVTIYDFGKLASLDRFVVCTKDACKIEVSIDNLSWTEVAVLPAYTGTHQNGWQEVMFERQAAKYVKITKTNVDEPLKYFDAYDTQSTIEYADYFVFKSKPVHVSVGYLNDGVWVEETVKEVQQDGDIYYVDIQPGECLRAVFN